MMGSLYKGKNSPYWHYKVKVEGKRKDISTKCKNRKDAEHYVKKYHQNLQEKIQLNIKVAPLLSVALKHYLNVSNVKKATQDSYKIACEHFITAAGEKRVDEYTIFDYEKFLTYLENYSESSKGIYTRSLYVIFNYYLKNEYIRRNPITAIRKKQKPKPIDPKELEIIKKYLIKKDYNFYKIIQLALLTGFRRSTICEVMGIDLQRMLINARNVKAGRDFVFPVYRELELFLRKEFRIKKYWVGRITPFTVSTISHKFQTIINDLFDKGKIRNKYNFHQLRHSAATEFGRKGLDIKAIKTMLDHSDIQTSEGYMQPDLEYIRGQMR